MSAHPEILAKISALLVSDCPARVAIVGKPYFGKTTILDQIEGHTHYCSGRSPRDVFDELPKALARGKVVLIDDLDKAQAWMSEPEDAALSRALRKSAAHVVVTSSSLASLTGVDDRMQVLTIGPLSRGRSMSFYSSLRPADGEYDGDVALAVRALSGGRPDRIVHMAFNLPSLVGDKQWSKILLQMTDRYTPEDTQAIERLSAGQRGIWAALAEEARGASVVCASAIADRRRMSSSMVSSFLARLVESGHVEVHRSTQSQFRYRLTDPVAQAHYLVRRYGLGEVDQICRDLIDRERARQE